MRKGKHTTELWVGAVGALIVGIQQAFFPEHPFPLEAFTTTGVWLVMRMGEKVFIDPENRPWKSTEFWLGLGFPVVKVFWPEMPPMFETFAFTYLVGRPAIKVGTTLRATPKKKK